MNIPDTTNPTLSKELDEIFEKHIKENPERWAELQAEFQQKEETESKNKNADDLFLQGFYSHDKKMEKLKQSFKR